MKEKKRLVTLKDYLRYVMEKTMRFKAGGMVATTGVFGLFAIPVITTFLLQSLLEESGTLPFWLGAGLIAFLAYFAPRMVRAGVDMVEEGRQLEPVAPLTRRNRNQLPDEEALVRASQEPTAGQEKILLRAAATVEESRPEELLRAATGN
jgi:hypothetical protein